MPSRLFMSKMSIQYWKSRVFVPPTNGTTECANYCVRFSYAKQRLFFNTHSPEKDIAARRARDIYKMVTNSEDGVAKAQEMYNTRLKRNTEEGSSVRGDTVGDLIRAVTDMAVLKAITLSEYVKSFRKVVAGVSGYKVTNLSHLSQDDYEVAKKKIDKAKLADITPQKVMAWRSSSISKAVKGGEDRLRVYRSLNSCIRNASGLFARKRLKYLRNLVIIPDVLPFEDIEKLVEASTLYNGKMNALRLAGEAQAELMAKHPESYKIFLLALYCGLRVSEIDHLMWSSIDLGRKVLHVVSNKYYTPKTKDSAGEIDLADDIVDYLSGLNRETEFVIQSTRNPIVNKTSSVYRCKVAITYLSKWLRGKGVDVLKPIHELRKECGSQINKHYGLHATSVFLRHKNTSVTAAHYVDKREKVVPKFD